MEPKILIVGTVPYNSKMTSRALDAFFHFYGKDNLIQIFSNAKKPCKGHCKSLFQITDKRLLDMFLGKTKDAGVIYNYNDLDDAWENSELDVSGYAKKMYKISGNNNLPLKHLLRKFLWNKKRWCSNKLLKWVDNFKPDVVFIPFSNDFFILEIALYFAEKYNIPIISFISDDYIFNGHFSIDPFYYIYRTKYKYLVKKVLSHNGSAVYISQKIADKYNSFYGLNGKPVYLSSEVERREYKEISKNNPLITYFGNIKLGRNESLNDIANTLNEINPNYKLHIYSNEKSEKYLKILKNNSNVVFHGSVPYKEVKEQLSKSDITVIVEGFKKNDVKTTRYSLSTKAADCIASGVPIFAYGSNDCGVINYLQECDCAEVCTDKSKLTEQIRHLIDDIDFQKKCYDNAIYSTKERNNVDVSTKIFSEVLNSVI